MARSILAVAVVTILCCSAQAQTDLLAETTMNLDRATAAVLEELRQQGLVDEAAEVESRHKEVRQDIQNEIARQLAGESTALQPNQQAGGRKFGLSSALDRESSQRASMLREANRKLKALAAEAEAVTDEDTKAVLRSEIRRQARSAGAQLDNLAGKDRWKRPLFSRENAGESCAQAQGSSISCSRTGDRTEGTGLLQQRRSVSRKIAERAKATEVAPMVERATKTVGEGRSGAGGVSLHLPAVFAPTLADIAVESAFVDNGRLVLKTEDGNIGLPEMPADFLALAIRAIYGNEALVTGHVLALDQGTFVLKTGPEQYGDVVWRREYLPVPVSDWHIGDMVSLPLGPAIGFTAAPRPSERRVTYYGPIRNTRLGHVLTETDILISTLWNNVDGRTGRPLKLHQLPGFQSKLEIEARDRIRKAEKENQSTETAINKKIKKTRNPDQPWWFSTTWYVWIPETVSLKLNSDGSGYQFDSVAVALRVWRSGQVEPSAAAKQLTRHASENFETLKSVFPVLQEFEDAAQTVAVIRALKAADVPLETDWAATFEQPEIKTVENFRAVTVEVERVRGLPRIEAAQ